MQWGQIKNIFIISFLVLNLFLVQQLIEKVNQTNIDRINQSTIEDQLGAEEITINELPESGLKESYVSAQQYQLTEEDLSNLNNKLDTQKIKVINNEIIVSEFIEPLGMNLSESLDQAISKVKDQILYGDSYTFWEYYEKENVLLFFQKRNNHTVYFNESGALIVLLNDEGQAIQYRQTMLEEVEQESEEQAVVDPMNAIEVLYNNNVFQYQDVVTSMNIGYHTLVPLEDGVQVFVPTWEVTVNDQRTYFVNAMEGQYIPNDEQNFVRTIKENLKREIEELNRSETE